VATRDPAAGETKRDETQELASGRPEWTPFATVGIVAVAIGVVAALVVALVFVVMWLA
jgi:hypothetical protein